MRMYALIWGQDREIHDTVYLGNFKMDDAHERAENEVERLQKLNYNSNPFPLGPHSIDIVSKEEFYNMKTNINSIDI